MFPEQENVGISLYLLPLLKRHLYSVDTCLAGSRGCPVNGVSNVMTTVIYDIKFFIH